MTTDSTVSLAAWRRRQAPAMQLLLACLSASGAPAPVSPLKPSGNAHPGTLTATEWAQFLGLIERHRVATLVWRGLQRLGLDAAPDNVRRELEARKRANVRRCLMQLRELLLLHQRFAAAGIPVLPIKGPALSQQLYGDPGLRHSNDIDLLVDPPFLGRADALLAAAGYLRQKPSFGADDARWPLFFSIVKDAVYAKPGGPALELHGRLQRVRALYPVSAGELLAAAHRLTMAGTEVPVLAPAEQLVYLASHGAQHDWFRLSWLSDIPPLLALMDASQQAAAQRRARALGLQRPLALALLLSQQAFATVVPAGFDPDGLRDPVVHRMAACAQAAIEGPVEPDLRVAPVGVFYRALRREFRLKRHWRYRLECLRKPLICARDVEALRLPAALSFLYIVLRPWLWLGRRIGNWLPASAGIARK